MHLVFERIYATDPRDMMNHVPTPEEQAKAMHAAQNVCEVVHFPRSCDVVTERASTANTEWQTGLMVAIPLSWALIVGSLWLLFWRH